jgi:O-antigen ligase
MILLLAYAVYDPLYGGAAIAAAALILLELFAPYFIFYGLIFALTGWPYYVGMPVGRDLPIPFVLPVIVVTFAFVLVRQALQLGALPQQGQRRPALHVAVFLLAAAIAVSVVAGGATPYSLQSYARAVVLPLMLFLIARHFISNVAVARRVLDLLLVGGAIDGVYSVYEWFLGQNPLIEWFAPPVGDLADRAYWTASTSGDITLYRSFGFGMNPIFVGTVMAILIGHAAIRFARANSVSAKFAFLCLGASVSAGLVATFSRGPILAATLAIALLSFAYPALRKYLFVGAAAVALYLAVHLFSAGNPLADRLHESDNVTLRLKLWQVAWRMFLDHPVFGVGLGRFPDYQLRVVHDHNIGPFFEFGDGRLELMRTAEEAFLQFLAETGLIGGAMGAALLACILWVFVSALFSHAADPRRDLLAASGLGIIVTLISGLTVTIYNSWEVGSIMPVLLAILCLPPEKDERGVGPTTGQRPIGDPAPMNSFPKA